MTSDVRRSVRAIMVAGGVSIVSVLPMFLVGGLAVQISGELAFGVAGIGIAVAGYRTVAAITSPFLGKVADRLGTTWSLRIAVILSSIANMGIAGGARSLPWLVGLLGIGGCSYAIGQPAGTRLISTSVMQERRGIAFGIKQAANPTASALAGLSVPLIALTFGWRWAFWIGAALAVTMLLGIGRNEDDDRARAGRRGERAAGGFDGPTIALFFTAFLLSMAVGTAVPTYYVAATVAAGNSAGLAGSLLAGASVAAIITRVASGALCDRIKEGHLLLFVGGLAAGVVGFLMLATTHPVLMGVGAVIALSGTWGFNGVFWFAVTKAFPGAPGQVTGALLPGGQLGGALGPLVLGFVIEFTSFRTAWLFTAALTVLGSYVMLLGARRIKRLATI